MQEELVFTFFLKTFILVTCPITFLVGIFLLYDVNTYLKIEKFLAKSYMVSRKQWASWLETNRESFQVFLLARRRILGVICLLNALAVFFLSLSLLKKA